MLALLIQRVASRRDAQNERDGAGLRSSVAAPSQQRCAQHQLRRSSQQHQLRRGRDAQNERDGAGLRISVAAATPSQQRLRRSSVAAALRAA